MLHGISGNAGEKHPKPTKGQATQGKKHFFQATDGLGPFFYLEGLEITVREDPTKGIVMDTPSTPLSTQVYVD